MQNTLLAMLLAIPLGLAATTGQSGTLSRLMSEARIEWLAGAWTGTDPEGRPLQLDYQPELDGHAGSMVARFEDRTVKAFIAVNPQTQEVKLFGAGSNGALFTGTWTEEWGDVVLTAEWKLPDGITIAQEQYVHRSSDGKTLRVQVYPVAGGYRVGPPKQEVILNRQNPDQPAPATSATRRPGTPQPAINSNFKG